MYDDIIAKYSTMYDVPEIYIRAVISTESSWNPNAHNASDPTGAYGLMQVLYRTAQAFGYIGAASGLFDPDTNIKYGTLLLQEIIGRVGNYPERIYSAYNSGNPDKYLTSNQVANNVNRFMQYLEETIEQHPEIAGAGVGIMGLVFIAVAIVLWKRRGR